MQRKILDIGCGQNKLPGAIGMDINPRSHADVIHNLDERPWPLEANTFDYVRARDVLEHVDDFIGAMEEIHRVSAPGAEVEIRMPFMSSENFATDPTHRRAGTSRTFDYFDPSTELGSFRYSTSRFDLIDFQYSRSHCGRWVGSAMRRFDYYLLPLIRKNARTYEHYFAYWYPMQDVVYRLRVVKDGAA
jgi:SAM-dependent methyltransferase